MVCGIADTILALTTQLFSIPPWAAAFMVSQVVAHFSDKSRHRFLFIVAPICITIVGFLMLLSIHDKRHVEYGALFLVTSGTYSAMPVVLCWFAMNLGGHKRRSVGTAYQIGFGNSTSFSFLLAHRYTDCRQVGGNIATYSFLSRNALNYRDGFIICVSFACLSGVACAAYLSEIRHANHQRDDAVSEMEARGYQISNENETETLGDLAITYRYIY